VIRSKFSVGRFQAAQGKVIGRVVILFLELMHFILMALKLTNISSYGLKMFKFFSCFYKLLEKA
jgi:hypothetical protein